MHGLLGILPIQVGITHDSLLTGDTLVGVSLAAEHGPDGISRLSQSAHSLSLLYHLAQLKLTHYPGVCSRKHLLHARRRRPETPVTPPANRDRSAGRFAHYMGHKNFLHMGRSVREFLEGLKHPMR